MPSDLHRTEQPPPEINTVDVYLVLTLALGDNPPPSFILDTRAHPLYRPPYDVYVLQYPDGTRYAVHVPIRMHGCPRTEIQDLIENEAANLEELAQVKFPYSPRPISYSATYVNYLRFPYIVTTFIEGTPLEWTDLTPHQNVRQWVLIQLAEIIYELTMCTLEHESGMFLLRVEHCSCALNAVFAHNLLIHQGMDAEQFLLDKIDSKIFQVIRKQRDDLSLHDCLFLRLLLRQISHIPNPLYPDTGPNVSNEPSNAAATALTHDNLCASNILIDDYYNIKGSAPPLSPNPLHPITRLTLTSLINWSVTKRLPLRFALKLPRLLGIQPNPHDTTIMHYIEVIDETAFPPAALTWSRAFYAQSLCTVIQDRAPDSLLTRCSPLCMDTTDLDWKHWVLASALSSSMHKWMRGNGYMLHRTAMGECLARNKKKMDEWLKEQLVSFCEDHLLEYASHARKVSALEAVKGLFTGMKNWAWAEQWLALQFGNKSR